MKTITNHQNIFCIYVCVHAGSIYESPKQAGMSHVLEHMLLKRTKQYSKVLLIDKLAEIGGLSNASTDKDITCYYIVTTSDNWKKAVDILSSVINFPEIANDEFELEKKVIIEEINMRKDNYMEYYNMAMNTILPNSNIYSNKVEGTPKLVSSFKKKYLLDYYKKRYDKRVVMTNCPYAIKKEVEKYIHEKFGSNKTAFNIEQPRLIFHSKVKVDYNDKQQYTHVISFPSCARKDQKTNCILNFIRFAVINGSFKSKFMNILRTKMGLVYSIGSINNTYMHIGLFEIEMSTTNDKATEILEIVLKLLYRLKKYGLTEKELKFFKKAYMTSKQLVFADEQFRTMWHCENIFYDSMITEREYSKMISDITNEDIMSVAKSIFDVKRIGILSYGRYKNLKSLENEIYKIISYQIRYEDSAVV